MPRVTCPPGPFVLSGAGSGRQHPRAPRRAGQRTVAPRRAKIPAWPLLGCGWHRNPEGENSAERREGERRAGPRGGREARGGAPPPGPAGSFVPPLRLRAAGPAGLSQRSGVDRRFVTPRLPAPLRSPGRRRVGARRRGLGCGRGGGAVRRGVKVSWRARVRAAASGRGGGGSALARRVARGSGGRLRGR